MRPDPEQQPPEAAERHPKMTPEQARQAAYGPWEFHSEKWELAYIKRIDVTIAALKSAGVPVIWVGLASQRGAKSSQDSSYLNELIAAGPTRRASSTSTFGTASSISWAATRRKVQTTKAKFVGSAPGMASISPSSAPQACALCGARSRSNHGQQGSPGRAADPTRSRPAGGDRQAERAYRAASSGTSRAAYGHARCPGRTAWRRRRRSDHDATVFRRSQGRVGRGAEWASRRFQLAARRHQCRAGGG